MTFRFWLLALLFLSSWVAAGQPNVILIMTDDQGYGDISAHGNSMINTPQIDRLHSESVRLTNYHVDPTCAPTRAALMTGRYSSRTGVWHTVMGRELMDPSETTVAEVFKNNGYRTAMVGKWHLGDNYPLLPEDRGFDYVLRHGAGGVSQVPDAWGNDYFDDRYWEQGKLKPFQGYVTDVFFDHAMEFIEAESQSPFFLYLSTNAPHGPFNVADSYAEPYRKAGVPEPMAPFYGMITNIDDNLGRLRDKLTELGIAENTILIFTTDNGTSAGVKQKKKPGQWSGYDGGMRGKKNSEYDGGHRVPFFLHWPDGNFSQGRDVKTLSAHIDVLPTLAELAGLQANTNKPIDGSSLVQSMRGQNDLERTLFVHSQRINTPEKWRKSAVMTPRWRLINGTELYDMLEDPRQQDDLAKTHPARVQQLREQYDGWWQSLEPSFSLDYHILVGVVPGQESRITSHDWQASGGPWNQAQVLENVFNNGPWAIEVFEPGRYRIELYQRDRDAAWPLSAVTAEIKIADTRLREKIEPGATSVTFDVTLTKGKAQLQTWLHDADNKSRGAFYVYVTRE
ncbi:MAG: arylsulfatase [Pseudomonadales bacterium]